MTCKTNTRWEVKDGELVYVGSGDANNKAVVKFTKDFPMNVDRVAALINEAFFLGMRAKAEQIKNALDRV